jgi:hypothetical protein
MRGEIKGGMVAAAYFVTDAATLANCHANRYDVLPFILSSVNFSRRFHSF